MDRSLEIKLQELLPEGCRCIERRVSEMIAEVEAETQTQKQE